VKRKRTESPSEAEVKKKTATATTSHPPQFEVFLVILEPLPQVRTKKTVPKTQEKKYGPIEIPTSSDWDFFLAAIAGDDGADCAIHKLRTASFLWKFINPQNSPLLPLTGPGGFASMICQMKEKKKYIVTLQMDKPKMSHRMVRGYRCGTKGEFTYTLYLGFI
jgi:hypothetical protein